jgi:hypothetical protein
MAASQMPVRVAHGIDQERRHLPRVALPKRAIGGAIQQQSLERLGEHLAGQPRLPGSW